MAGADEGTGRQNRGKRTPAKRQRTRQQGGAQAEAPSLVSVKTLEATAEKKTLTVSERRGWTETRYLPQAVSYSGDTDWSKIARETVLPDRSRPRRVKERNGNVAPRVRARPAQTARRVNYDDDNWQPTSDSAHLEGITRSMKRDERQQRWGGTPGFAARLGQPFDPNAAAAGVDRASPTSASRVASAVVVPVWAAVQPGRAARTSRRAEGRCRRYSAWRRTAVASPARYRSCIEFSPFVGYNRPSLELSAVVQELLPGIQVPGHPGRAGSCPVSWISWPLAGYRGRVSSRAASGP